MQDEQGAADQLAADDYDVWGSLHMIHNVMYRNAQDFLGVLVQLETDLETIVAVSQTGMNVAFETIVRLAHNYLSARQMLVDHTRNTLRRYDENPVLEAYAKEVRKVTDHPAGPVLQRMRNYLVHYRVPPFVTQMEFSSPPSIKLYLKRDQMLQYKEWTKPARDFLESQGDLVELRVLIEEDLSRLEALYRWLYGQIGALHPFLKRSK